MTYPDARRKPGPEMYSLFSGSGTAHDGPSITEPAASQLPPGRLNNAIATALVEVHKRYVGRGPTKVRALAGRNVIVLVMKNGMTTAEKTLVERGEHDLVRRFRRGLQQAMHGELKDVVEQLVGCHVGALVGGCDPELDLAVEVFFLERPARPSPSR